MRERPNPAVQWTPLALPAGKDEFDANFNKTVAVYRQTLDVDMRLTQGSVVELDHIAGEPLDLLVNNTVVAQGEVVLVNDRYGIRLTRVVPASERMKNI